MSNQRARKRQFENPTKKNLINVVGAKSKLMADIEIATGRIFKHHISNVPESSNVTKNGHQKCHQKENNIPPVSQQNPARNRPLNRNTPPPQLQTALQQQAVQQQQARNAGEMTALNKMVVANVKVPNPSRPKPAQKLPADQVKTASHGPIGIGQKRSRQTTSPDIVVVDLETKVEASSPPPSYQQGFFFQTSLNSCSTRPPRTDFVHLD